MEFIHKQTLESTSFVKIAVLLWNQQDVRELVAEFTNSNLFSQNDGDLALQPVFTLRKEKWQKIEDQVTSKLVKLNLPVIMKDKMLGFVQSVGLQILKFLEYHRRYYCLRLNSPNKICWTPQGTIDKKKTAEFLVGDERVAITTRYKLACIYCLEDSIFQIFYRLSESEKGMFYSEEDPRNVLQPKLVVFWGYYVNGEVDKMKNYVRTYLNYRCCYIYMFKCAAESGNKAATEYFLQKLSPVQKPLVSTALDVISKHRDSSPKIIDPAREYYTEVFCFLLSQMSEEQQIRVFETKPAEVMCCFLDWPWQSFFPEIVRQLWNFLPLTCYHFVFESILYKLCVGYKDYDYEKAFRDIWQQISDDKKRYVMNNDNIIRILKMLLRAKDEENFKFIFQNATLIDYKFQLIFGFEGHYLCKLMIDCDKWDLFKYFVHLLISSKGEMIKFKKSFEKYVQTGDGRLGIDKYEKLFPLLDDLVREYDKRKNVDEAGSSSTKRLCSTEFKDVASGLKD